eukprot:XP_024306313.1 uncharacterized protein LOC107984974 isoform X4 [Homo sapiens]
MSNPGSRRNGPVKLHLTGLPDPFAKVVVDGSGQCHSIDTVKNMLDPKWNQHYDLYIEKSDSVTISVWNHKKIHKKQGAGFLRCVHLFPVPSTTSKTLVIRGWIYANLGQRTVRRRLI